MSEPKLKWRDAQHSDRKGLQQFKCTVEDLRMEVSVLGLTPVHDAMYAWNVQEAIRDLRVPLGRKWLVRLGLDQESRIGAIQVTQEITPGGHYDLVFGAVSVHLQGRGLFLGDEMMEDTLEIIASRCADLGVVEDVLLTTTVHRDNSSAQKMCTRNQFRNNTISDDSYDDWRRYLPVPGAD